MDRKTLLVRLRVAGYHEDRRDWTRLYVEGRVSFHVARQEWDRGQAMRSAGVRCTCRECAAPTT